MKTPSARALRVVIHAACQLGMLLAGIDSLAQQDGIRPFLISATYRDLDGDQDGFPDTGESGRVVIHFKNDQWAMAGAIFHLSTIDPDVACISEWWLGAESIAKNQEMTLGSLDPGEPGFTFRTSTTLKAADGAGPPTIDLCLNVRETPPGTSRRRLFCFSLPADLDLPSGAPPAFIPGPDGIAGTGDDGVLLESFDIDRDGDDRITVHDTFGLLDQGTGALGTGFYQRGGPAGGPPDRVAGVPCSGFLTVEDGNAECTLDPDFPMDWHLHCPPSALNCPNHESGACVGGCSYRTPADGIKALSPPNSLHMGAHFDPNSSLAGDTTHLRALQAFVSPPINLTPRPRPGDLQLSMFHIVDLMDSNGVYGGISWFDKCNDCAHVQVQIDADPDPAVDAWGPWGGLAPFENVYDHQVLHGGELSSSISCLFTPADAGDAPPAPYGVHETTCFPAGGWSHCGSVRGFRDTHVTNCRGPGRVDPSGSGVWVETRFDLTSYPGQRIRVRWIGATWQFEPGSSTYFEEEGSWAITPHDDGWWLDDLRMTGVIPRQTSPNPDRDAPPAATCPAGACFDRDGDGFGAPAGPACPAGSPVDCDDSESTRYPEALEVNNGMDDQCPGNAGFGVNDEISGPLSWHSWTSQPPADTLGWYAQSGATSYQVARATQPDFGGPCKLEPWTGSNLRDQELPPPGGAYFYLVRALSPHLGSWGQDAAGVERAGLCGVAP